VIAGKIALASVGVAAVGLGFGFYARSFKKDAQNGPCDNAGVCNDQGRALLDSAHTWATVTDVTLIVSAVTVVVAGVVFTSAPPPVRLEVGGTSASLVVGGRF